MPGDGSPASRRAEVTAMAAHRVSEAGPTQSQTGRATRAADAARQVEEQAEVVDAVI